MKKRNGVESLASNVTTFHGGHSFLKSKQGPNEKPDAHVVISDGQRGDDQCSVSCASEGEGCCQYQHRIINSRSSASLAATGSKNTGGRRTARGRTRPGYKTAT